MMRIAKAYNPVIEIQQALDCVNEKGTVGGVQLRMLYSQMKY